MEKAIRSLAHRAGAVITIGQGMWRALDENFAPSWGGNHLEVFRMAALDVLIAEGRRVAQCSWRPCRKLFVRRKRGAYCSRACSQKARTARYVKAQGRTWREKRHAYYVSQVEKLKGSAVAKKVKMRSTRIEGSEQK
jgi:hypothetical protein